MNRVYLHIDTVDTIREDASVPPPNPEYLAHLDELLALRVGHLPVVGSAGDWRLQVQLAGAGECHYDRAWAYPIPEGCYMGLYQGPPGRDTIWMTDAPYEVWTMWDGIEAIRDPSCRRVLITGLGLGVILQHALRQPHVTRVDVVERDADVIRLIRPHFRDRRLTVHHGDALALDLGPRRVWDVAYHDIWQRVTAANLPGMIQLTERFAGRVGRQRCWRRADCEHQLAEHDVALAEALTRAFPQPD